MHIILYNWSRNSKPSSCAYVTSEDDDRDSLSHKKKPLTAVTATGNDVIAAIIETILRTAAVAAETAKMFNDVSTALY